MNYVEMTKNLVMGILSTATIYVLSSSDACAARAKCPKEVARAADPRWRDGSGDHALRGQESDESTSGSNARRRESRERPDSYSSPDIPTFYSEDGLNAALGDDDQGYR